MKTEKRKAIIGENVLIIKNEEDISFSEYDRYQEVVGKVLQVYDTDADAVRCNYNNETYDFFEDEYLVIVKNPLKLKEFMDMLTINLEYNYRDLLEYHYITNDEMEEIAEWFAKFDIQI